MAYKLQFLQYKTLTIKSNKEKQTLYCAGQASVDAEGKPVCKGDMRAQIIQDFNNLEQVLTGTGFSLSDVIRLNYYTTSVDGFFAQYDAVLKRIQAGNAHFSSTLLGVSRLAFPQLLVEVEATGIKYSK